MKRAFTTEWGYKNRYLLLNILFILAIGIGFISLITRNIDVLQDWTVTVKQVHGTKNGLPIYNPGDSLVFVSTSTKVADASGTTTRMIVCDATERQKAREIQLDTLPATRPPGKNPPRENAIVVPDVSQFNGLPRTCSLHIDICYDNVILWRDHCEHAQSNKFLVEESKLDADAIKKNIEDLRNRVKELERMLVVAQSSQPTVENTPTKEDTTVSTREQGTKTDTSDQTDDETPNQDDEGLLYQIPIVGGLIKGVGL